MLSFVSPFEAEFLGEGFQIMMTPLTERTFVTICEAFQHNLCGWAEGPSGVGKTFTVTKISRALDRPCMILHSTAHVEIEVHRNVYTLSFVNLFLVSRHRHTLLIREITML